MKRKIKITITIGRQFGSGGYEIGKRLAELFGISFYDKELIALAAKESGLNKAFFENADERSTHSLSYAFSLGLPYTGMFTPYTNILSNDGLFKLQSDTIRKLAKKHSCVLVGRCANYLLKDDPNSLSIFIHSPLETRIARIMDKYKLNKTQAVELINQTDKDRATYYNYYTNQRWDEAPSYNLSIDSSIFGIEETALFLKGFIQTKYSDSTFEFH